MNLQEHLSRYNHDEELKGHLESVVNFILNETDVEMDFSKSYISFKIPGNGIWAWIDTQKGSNMYKLHFKNRYLGQHEIENLQLDIKGIEINTGNKDFLKLNIYKNFDYTQPGFTGFIKEHYQKYRRHKEEG
ncbi:MAG TPA: hypothetical protein VKY40_00190, partial [Halanaerobiales bacterium]|nr:hypothetical protein [Halanaerobiales bacterium]